MINKKNYLMLLLSIIFLAGCDNNDDFELSAKSLQQTVWKGSRVTMKPEGGEPYNRVGVILFFVSDKRVTCSIETDYNTDRRTFEYTVSGKVLTIINNNPSNPQLSGDWIVKEKTKESLVLLRNPGSSQYFVMELERIE